MRATPAGLTSGAPLHTRRYGFPAHWRSARPRIRAAAGSPSVQRRSSRGSAPSQVVRAVEGHRGAAAARPERRRRGERLGDDARRLARDGGYDTAFGVRLRPYDCPRTTARLRVSYCLAVPCQRLNGPCTRPAPCPAFLQACQPYQPHVKPNCNPAYPYAAAVGPGSGGPAAVPSPLPSAIGLVRLRMGQLLLSRIATSLEGDELQVNSRALFRQASEFIRHPEVLLHPKEALVKSPLAGRWRLRSCATLQR
jgi:hypothetical protein